MLFSIPVRRKSLILLATWFFSCDLRLEADAAAGARHLSAQQQQCNVASCVHSNIQREASPPSMTCRRRRRNERVALLETISRGGGDSSSSSVLTTTLRVRLPDGSLQRLVLPTNQLSSLTLNDALAPILLGFTAAKEEISVTTSSSSSSSQSVDRSQTLHQLGLRHGSLVTLTHTKKSSHQKPHQPSFSLPQKHKKERFDPFPDLARDYDAAALRWKQHRQNRGVASSSYAALASLQSELHVVDPQPQGKIQRVYMCAMAASRLQSHCHTTTTMNGQQETKIENRVGLLLGTIARERRKLKKQKARTSLSSSVPEDDYCQAVKVHAVWEPPHQTTQYKNGSTDLNNDGYDGTALWHWWTRHAAVPRVAKYLGLQPLGWIFTYAQDRSGKDGLPVLARDIQTGATLQIDNMKQPPCVNDDSSSSSSSRFVTLAMDSRTGATEAFQLSDVSVQMVAEDMFVLDDTTDTDSTPTSFKKKNDCGVVRGRYVTTRHPVIVDGKETQQLDSVLCLVNTALLSHTGMYAGGGGTQGSTKKKNGALTSKTRKAIVKALKDDGSDDGTGRLLAILCDFSVLLALDELLTPQESERLFQVVQKWARGQKKTAKVDDKLKQRLNQLLLE